MANLRSAMLGIGLGLASGYLLAQQAWRLRFMANIQPRRTLLEHSNRAPVWQRVVEEGETAVYSMRHTIEDGIERIVYTPKQRRYATPILMQHGMWHGAWCWQPWQEIFAEWGWETHAYSLPGHAGSPVQRPLAQCTLDYYLGFLKAEVERLPRKPVLMGHSMGGALAQWYLKYVGDDLPATALVAPWTSHSIFRGNFLGLLRLDPIGCALIPLTWDAGPLVRNPRAAAGLLLGPQAPVTPEQLHARLNSESVLVLFQHNPPYWQPPEAIHTPMLIAAGELDMGVALEELRRSAQHYRASFIVASGAGHNLMMEHNSRQTAQAIQDWLAQQDIL